jgi:hypothetical protein
MIFIQTAKLTDYLLGISTALGYGALFVMCLPFLYLSYLAAGMS